MHEVATTIDALQAPWRSGLSPVSGTAVEDSVAPVDAWVNVTSAFVLAARLGTEAVKDCAREMTRVRRTYA
jgi:hypothetical protein